MGELKFKFYGLTLDPTANEGSSWDAKTCNSATCLAANVVDDCSEEPAYIKYKTGISWTLGIENLLWEPGMCLSLDVLVFGWEWAPEIDVKLSFTS